MLRTALIALAVVACVQARPQFVFPASSSAGQSSSGITKGESIGPAGISTITQQQVATGGNAANGGFNIGSANANNQRLSGLQGTQEQSNTNAVSNQGSGFPVGNFGNFGGGFPPIPSFPSFGQAQGQSSSGITKGETIGPAGISTITQQQTATGGTAQNGGFNIGSANANNQRLTGILGTQEQSNTNVQSNQGSGFPGVNFGNFGGGFHGLPAFSNFGQATGSANSQLTQGTSVGLDGSKTTVTSLGSSAEGSAQNGATSINQSSGSTSSVDGINGSQTQSNLGSQSIQFGR